MTKKARKPRRAPLCATKPKPGRAAGVQTAIDKREAFVAAYMGEAKMNATLAATIAGYASDSASITASRLLDEPAVIAKINEIKAKRRAEQEERAVEIGEMLYATAMGRTIATVGVSEGAPIMGEPKHADRLRAGELFLKMNGGLAEKIEVTSRLATSEELFATATSVKKKEGAEARAREVEEKLAAADAKVCSGS